MATPAPDEARTLVIRMFVTHEGEPRIRLIELGGENGELILGTLTSAAAAAALVRGWIDAAVDAVSRPDPALDR